MTLSSSPPPHPDHVGTGISALNSNLHVLMEKPIAVSIGEAQKLLEASKYHDQILAVMFNQRTDPLYQEAHHIIRHGLLGNLQRFNWTVTDWFRTEQYYKSSSWKGTWVGEGGGVLMNQCPHQLDLLQWILGMPLSVHAFCQLGRYHDIEVEDTCTAYLEYKHGMTGTFITSTGEFPGINRLEVVGTKGLLTIDHRTLRLQLNDTPSDIFSKASTDIWAHPISASVSEKEISKNTDQYEIIAQNFANAILEGEHILVPGDEAIKSLELANSMLYSAMEKKTVQLPLDSERYEAFLDERCGDKESSQ